MNAGEWIAAYAERLGTDAPTAQELKDILGRSLEESLALAQTVAQAPGS